ncbi:MAG: hypothetical protein ACOYJC_08660 [Christensenellales bacterium]|jgi:uridine kinase
MKRITVNGEKRAFDNVETLLDIAKQTPGMWLGAICDQKIQSLRYPIDDVDEVTLLSYDSPQGEKIYVHSLTMLLICAIKELFPDGDVLVDHSLGNGIYCEVQGLGYISIDDYRKIDMHMRKLIEEDHPFECMRVGKQEAAAYFREVRQFSTADAIEQSARKTFTLYQCGEVKELAFYALVPSTGYIREFGLHLAMPGIILHYSMQPGELSYDYTMHARRSETFLETEKRMAGLECFYVSQLNRKIEQEEVFELVRVSEIWHEKQLGSLADIISSDPHRQLIFVAGPSSSGKTTSSNRLISHLYANGKHPVLISMDNYYRDRDEMPLDENGEKDFENITALDLDVFDSNLNALLQQQEVELPVFNFLTGSRDKDGIRMRVPSGEPIIIEGIHALNPQLASSIANHYKFKVYVAPLVTLNWDIHNRVESSFVRLLRRMVRDYHTRGSSASNTLDMWDAVLQGEKKFILPYQETADFTFNTALLYELSVLKRHALPILMDAEDRHASTVNEILYLLDFVTDGGEIIESHIPPTSILREFIGNNVYYL